MKSERRRRARSCDSADRVGAIHSGSKRGSERGNSTIILSEVRFLLYTRAVPRIQRVGNLTKSNVVGDKHRCGQKVDERFKEDGSRPRQTRGGREVRNTLHS